MSNNESFIDEVTEEVRRDQLFQYMRKYGWIAVLVVLVLVGGTAFNEYRKAQSQAQAEATGDAILDALKIEDSAERGAALVAIDASGSAAAMTRLLAAQDLNSTGDMAGAVAALDAIATDPEVTQLYRDLAALKSAMIQAETADADTRRAMLAGLSQPGAAFRMVALEQLALIDVQEGNTDAAIEQFRAIALDAETTRGLRERAVGMIVAMGGSVDDLAEIDGQGTATQ